MKKYYRFEWKDTNWQGFAWVIYILGIILITGLGWKFWLFYGASILAIIFFLIKLRVIKKRD